MSVDKVSRKDLNKSYRVRYQGKTIGYYETQDEANSVHDALCRQHETFIASLLASRDGFTGIIIQGKRILLTSDCNSRSMVTYEFNRDIKRVLELYLKDFTDSQGFFKYSFEIISEFEKIKKILAI